MAFWRKKLLTICLLVSILGVLYWNDFFNVSMELNYEEISRIELNRQLSILDSLFLSKNIDITEEEAKDNYRPSPRRTVDINAQVKEEASNTYRPSPPRRPGDGALQAHNIPNSTREDVPQYLQELRSRLRGEANRPPETPRSRLQEPAAKPKPNAYSILDSAESSYTTEVISWCESTKTRYQVIPLSSYGTMPKGIRNEWQNKKCGGYYINLRMNSRGLTVCSNTAAHYAESMRGPQSAFPLIAVMAATTTRNVKVTTVTNIALFKLMLPSLVRSVDCGYRYMYVMGYDAGDKYYDDEDSMRNVLKWFKDHIEDPMRKNGILITLVPVRVANPIKKPGPVFLEMARKAYELGADFMYRINDDTEFETPFARAYVNAVMGLKPPYGIVGPSSSGTIDRILTHDFVHRTHLEIFEMNYYPPPLSDWWMDDWITVVYGQKRTFLSKHNTVKHHTSAHGQRYKVDQSHKKTLKPLIAAGRVSIRKWMLSQDMDNSLLKEFDTDLFDVGINLIELPMLAKSIRNSSFWCTSEERATLKICNFY